MSRPVETYLAKASVNGVDLHVLEVQATSEMAALRVARGFWPDSVITELCQRYLRARGLDDDATPCQHGHRFYCVLCANTDTTDGAS